MLPKSVLVLLVATYLATSTSAQIPLVYSKENTGTNCEAPPLPEPGDLSSYPMLPNPFAWSDGSGQVTDFSEWECRRNEIKAEIEHYEIGPKPATPAEVNATYANNTLTVHITENGQSLTLTSSVSIPEGDGPFPVVIGMNNPTGSLPSELFDGVIKIAFMHDQVVTYTQTSNRNMDDPYYDLYPDLTYVGNYSAWAWGVSRLIDGIELVQSELKADLEHLAVTGCSYAGKMALFSGAYDERIALTIVQESGGGGINSWRVSETIGNVEKIDNTNYAWFMESMKTNFAGKVSLLPHDHHELMAMVVPRAMLVLGNPPFEWLGDESGYVSSRAVQEVYKRFEIEDRFGFSFRSGHNHCSLPTESYAEVQAFVDKFLFEDETVNTNIQVHEFDDVDYNSWISAWKEPADPNAPTITIDSPEDNQTYEAPVTITIETSVSDQNDNVAKVLFYNGQELLGEDSEAPYSITLTDLGVGNYYFSAEAVDTEGLKGYSSIVSILVKAPKIDVISTGTPPIIDGSIDDIWSTETITPFTLTNTLIGTDLTDEDLSATAKMLWDETYVYLLAMVTDDEKQNDSPNTYEDDNVEFYFDINNAKTTTYDADDVQYSFAWNDGTTVGALPASKPVDGIVYSISDTDQGYVVEAKIPWSTLNGTPADGMEIGFDMMVNDDDDGGGRDAKLSWNAAEDQAWQNAALFGTVKLVRSDAIAAPALQNVSSREVSIYPNPVSATLTLEGLHKGSDFQIFNNSGHMMLSGKVQDSINVKQLTKGVYILKIDSEPPRQLKFVKE